MEKDYFYNEDSFEFNGDLFGKAGIQSVKISKKQLDDAISEIVLNSDNLKFLFGISPIIPLIGGRKERIIQRFLPQIKEPNTFVYVNNALSANPNFYSFLGEAVMAILMRDIFELKLSVAVLRNLDTIFDGHTGVDSCFYDSKKKVIVLGEAKFYQQLDKGIGDLKENFVIQDKLRNQLESLFKHAQDNRKSKKIILQSAGKSIFERLSFEDFLDIRLIFAGFVMHDDCHATTGKDLKNKCNFTSDDIEKHVTTLYPFLKELNYSLIVFHLPVDSKKQLITKVIDKAYEIYEGRE